MKPEKDWTEKLADDILKGFAFWAVGLCLALLIMWVFNLLP